MAQSIAVVPKEGFEFDIYKNPYIAYNCLRLIGDYSVVGNGSHTDPIAEKLETGMGIRDAIVLALCGLDYEHDEYETPRITAVVDIGSRLCALGIVRRDALVVREFDLEIGEALYLVVKV